MPSNSIARIRAQAAQIRRIVDVPGRDLASTRIPNSSWSAAAHLDHTLKVALSILSLLAKAEIAAAPRGINLVGRLVLLLDWMPRGRGKAPERLHGVQATAEELRAQLTTLEEVLGRVAAKDDGRTSRVPIVRHPTFGGLTHSQSLRFIAIHTDHHLKIVGMPAQ